LRHSRSSFSPRTCLLPPTLEDIDSINFALGVRDFDVARHQPILPAIRSSSRSPRVISTAVFRAVRIPAADVRGSRSGVACRRRADSAAVLVLPRAGRRAPRVVGDRRDCLRASLLVHRAAPLSDMTGWCSRLQAQALLAAVILARASAGALIGGAFLSALAFGVRSQTVLLTFPLLLWALALPGAAIGLRQRALAAAAAVIGGLLWGVPLLLASGGLASYMTALGSQAGEDFSGVVILWTVRVARVAAQALAFTFLRPWGAPWIGAGVIVVASAGALLLAWRAPRLAILLGVAFVPYAIFHLLFHEIVTVRARSPRHSGRVSVRRGP
jgi:hypothetical protein